MGDWVDRAMAVFVAVVAAGLIARPRTWRLRGIKAEAELVNLLPKDSPGHEKLAAHVAARVEAYVTHASQPSRGWDLFSAIAWILMGLDLLVWMVLVLTASDSTASAWWLTPLAVPPVLYVISIGHDVVEYIRWRGSQGSE